CGKHSHRARLIEGKVDVWIDRERSWTTCYDGVSDVASAACRADDLEPVTRNVNRLAKRDRQVRIQRHICRAVGRRGGRNRWRLIDREAEDKGRRHIVRRIDAVLIGDLRGEDSYCH